MAQQEESQNKKKLRVLTMEERMKIMTYPTYLQGSVQRAAENSTDSIEEIYEDIKLWEDIL